MKKLLLFSLACTLISASAYAQTYDETQLIGRWELTDMEGEHALFPKAPTAIELGDSLYTWSYNSDGSSDVSTTSGMIYDLYIKGYYGDWEVEKAVEVVDFFISNGNKLHIIPDDVFGASLRFVIVSLTEKDMVLQTYDGKCTFSLTRAPKSAIQAVRSKKSASENAYDLAGKRIKSQTADGVYIQGGEKKLRRK